MRQGHRCEACQRLENMDKRCYSPLQLPCEQVFESLDFGCTASAQLHHFSDASEYAYGTVSYLLLENTEGTKHCAFLMGKSRVAPLKVVTIPRLELTAAVVAVKVESTFWTDSTTVQIQ